VQQLPWEAIMATVSITSERRRRLRLKRIVISEHNYLALKKLGQAGDSFNDVISKLLRIERIYQEMKKQEEEQKQENNDSSDSGLPSIPIPSAEFEEQNRQQMAELVQLLRSKRRGSIGRNDQTIKQESNKEEPGHTGT
jgi:predicted CopG family antitoxin